MEIRWMQTCIQWIQPYWRVGYNLSLQEDPALNRWVYARANPYNHFKSTKKTSLLGALFGVAPLFILYYVFKTDRVRSYRRTTYCQCIADQALDVGWCNTDMIMFVVPRSVMVGAEVTEIILNDFNYCWFKLLEVSVTNWLIELSERSLILLYSWPYTYCLGL
jgi:hypothetical protein